jgi:hypothetical protein
MQYIPIKKTFREDKEIYTVAAISLKNTNKTVVQKIPHPLGSDTIDYETLDEAKEAITLAGFSYILPDGQKGTKATIKQKIVQHGFDYEKIVLDSIKDKINSANATVSAAAILAISEFPSEETFDILFSKLGEDNDQIRKNTIAGICRYGNLLGERIVKTLKSPNWVARNSAITCISTLAENGYEDIEKFIIPLGEICNDTNTIVQANALSTIAKVYQKYKKTTSN